MRGYPHGARNIPMYDLHRGAGSVSPMSGRDGTAQPRTSGKDPRSTATSFQYGPYPGNDSNEYSRPPDGARQTYLPPVTMPIPTYQLPQQHQHRRPSTLSSYLRSKVTQPYPTSIQGYHVAAPPISPEHGGSSVGAGPFPDDEEGPQDKHASYGRRE
jgi:hypothetical protein